MPFGPFRHRAFDCWVRQPTNKQPTNQQTNKTTSQQSNKATSNKSTNKPTDQQSNKEMSKKTIKKRTEVTPKSEKNQERSTKMAPKSVLEGYVGLKNRSWRASWGGLGAILGPLGRLWAASWPKLAPRARNLPKMVPTWKPKCPNMEAKSHQKSFQRRSKM